MSNDINKPAKYLTGKTLKGDWIVKENITKTFDNQTSGFIESYIVQNNSEIAILKALDFSIALLDEDPPVAMNKLTKSFEFERELHKLCKSKRLTRIVHILAEGNIPALEGSIIPVPYFILEYSDKDIKSQIGFDSRFNITWLLRILHNVTVGLWQLHGQGVAHKNLRPENIREFSKQLQKITELGSSDKKGIKNPNKEYLTSDDPAYLTPEYLYGQVESDWKYRSQASDMYQLGNLILFLFTQSNFNTWLFFGLDNLNTNFRPEKWGGTYEEILPYLIEAYDWAISEFFIPYIGGESKKLKDELETTIRQLCHPDPTKRGHPKNISSRESSFSVERYISRFNSLATLAEINLLTSEQ